MRIAVVPLVSAAALAGVAAPASAWLHFGSTTKYPTSGGTWTYGFWDAKVHSNYYHGSKCHGSTVKFYNGSSWSSDSTNALAGRWANAAVGAYNLWYTDDSYYYRSYCWGAGLAGGGAVSAPPPANVSVFFQFRRGGREL